MKRWVHLALTPGNCKFYPPKNQLLKEQIRSWFTKYHHQGTFFMPQHLSKIQIHFHVLQNGCIYILPSFLILLSPGYRCGSKSISVETSDSNISSSYKFRLISIDPIVLPDLRLGCCKETGFKCHVKCVS